MLARTVPCTHIVVNDGGEPPEIADNARTQLIHLPTAHRDVGNAARAIGSVTAICQGFDALAYLDADNWYAIARATAGTTSTLASLRPPRQSGSRGTRRSAGSSRGQHFEAIK